MTATGDKKPKETFEDEVKRLTALLDSGRLTDAQQAAIFTVWRNRLGEQMSGLPWTITIGTVVICAEDLSLLAYDEVEQITGHTWATCDPENSAQMYRAIVAAHLVIDRGWPQDDVSDLLRSLKGQTAISASISRSVVSPAPFAVSAS